MLIKETNIKYCTVIKKQIKKILKTYVFCSFKTQQIKYLNKLNKPNQNYVNKDNIINVDNLKYILYSFKILLLFRNINIIFFFYKYNLY